MSVRVRSLLFTPGNVSKMLLKGSSSQAHVQIVDLEDSVPASQKETARVTARQFLETAKQNSLLCVRVNNTRRLLEGDLDACVVAGVWGVSVGKVGSGEEMRHLDALVQSRRKEGPAVKLLPWIETARGVENALDIASASPNVFGLCFGADDLRADMQVERDDLGVAGPLMMYARIKTAVAARAARVAAFDTPWVDIKNLEGLNMFVASSKSLGFTGAHAIHPSHVDAINSGYAPSQTQAERAFKIVSAFVEAGTSAGRGSLMVDGQMVDVPVLRAAILTLQQSQNSEEILKKAVPLMESLDE